MNTRNQMDSHARERAFWSALAANWEKLAKEAEEPGTRP